MATPTRKTIELKTVAVKPDLSGFQTVHRALDNLKAHVASVNAAIASIGSPTAATNAAAAKSVARHRETATQIANIYKNNLAKQIDVAYKDAQGKISDLSRKQLLTRSGHISRLETTDYKGNSAIGGSIKTTVDLDAQRRKQNADELRRYREALRRAGSEDERVMAERLRMGVGGATNVRGVQNEMERRWSEARQRRASELRRFRRDERFEADLNRIRGHKDELAGAYAGVYGDEASRREMERKARESKRQRDQRFDDDLNRIRRHREEVSKLNAKFSEPIRRGGVLGLFDRLSGNQGRLIQRGLRGFTPTGFATNLLTVGGWTAAVGALYGGVNLAKYSYGRMENIQLQTARLQQVFRGAGGDATQLADDVLKLATAEGRATDEAMQAAIAWSRLGLTRKEVAEATRVSLMAANVAEMSAADTTQHFASIMSGFKLEAGQLQMVLGMLNQTSNTYRVTVGELLQGLSRVGSIAQQAGMSLAEVQGILGVTVQKTGQSGANMANALKTTLVRSTRTDVSESLRGKGVTSAPGSTEWLSEVYTLYQKGNDAQQRDLLLKIGSATQANRLRAILDTYAESLDAAIKSLTNLNSAEAENIKITNTAAAARQRVVSSWDRFVNSPAVEQYMAGQFNNVAGIIGGLTPDRQARQQGRRYHNPSQATFTGSLMGYADIMGWGRDINTLTGGWWQRTKDRQQGFSDQPSTAGDFDAILQQAINKRSGRSQAASLKSKLLGMGADNYGGASGNKAAWESLLAPYLSADQMAAVKGGDTSVLKDAAKRAKDEAASEFAKSQAQLALRERELKKRRDALALDDPERKGLDQEIEHASRRRAEDAEKYAESLVDAKGSQIAIKEAMEQQSRLAKDLAGVYKEFGLGSYLEQLLGAEAALAGIKRQMDAMPLDPKTGMPAKGPVYDALEKQQSDLAREVEYQNTAGRRFETARLNRASAMGFYGAQNKGEDFGFTSGESLITGRNAMMNRFNGLANRVNAGGKLSENEVAEGESLIVSLRQRELEIANRIVEVDRERKQLTIDTAREFQRSLVGSGPAELLRKMAVMRAVNKGMTSGAFFSLSPEAQREAYALQGGDKHADLNRESTALKGYRKPVDGMQSFERIMATWAEKFARQQPASFDVAAAAAAAVNANMGSAARSSATIAANMAAAAQSSASGASRSGVSAPAQSATRPANAAPSIPMDVPSPTRFVHPTTVEAAWDDAIKSGRVIR